MKNHVWAVKNRRLILADEVRGLVVAIAFFDSSGELAGRPAPQLYVYEMFKVTSGRLRSIMAWVRKWDPDTPQ